MVLQVVGRWKKTVERGGGLIPCACFLLLWLWLVVVGGK